MVHWVTTAPDTAAESAEEESPAMAWMNDAGLRMTRWFQLVLAKSSGGDKMTPADISSASRRTGTRSTEQKKRGDPQREGSATRRVGRATPTVLDFDVFDFTARVTDIS
ncbi:hypothetical protein PHYPSEUDO_007163 [Phytophthora pseudosyringae]|uniref:Uncharacterized protein n=1 Tax=Phytophthora pseudosyringae TaxID=221518 RepID=A0A8T1VHE1_9STRA|nr:hypothetical protein PHYPSEUDO_007163 [Phytophthora pseudosyringae]